MVEKDIPSWNDACKDFLTGMFESMSPEFRDHMKGCKYCSNKTGPMLKECYEVLMPPFLKIEGTLNAITLIIGTHMGLDPSKFPMGAK